MIARCSITQMCDDHTIVFTMEEAEAEFGNELALVLLGRHDFFAGNLVSGDTPLGYVEDGPSLISYEVSRYEFSEYAEQECNWEDRYG